MEFKILDQEDLRVWWSLFLRARLSFLITVIICSVFIYFDPVSYAPTFLIQMTIIVHIAVGLILLWQKNLFNKKVILSSEKVTFILGEKTTYYSLRKAKIISVRSFYPFTRKDGVMVKYVIISILSSSFSRIYTSGKVIKILPASDSDEFLIETQKVLPLKIKKYFW